MSPKVTDPGTLRTLLEGARKTGKRIVFTNGCFDIVHVGHVRYLREAGKLGDILVVGLNSDRSVSSLKSGRPVTPEVQRAEVLAALEMVDYVVVFDEETPQRAEVLAALEMVDYVVVFDEETPYELIKLLKPDVLVKGGDWKKEDIVGSDIVPDTRSLPFVEGISTSSVIERIRNLPGA
jgi:D-beta-D-heptose 7-phosphate kinase/D-beta-D-heptose 1-phosphate adenosyltransferase